METQNRGYAYVVSAYVAWGLLPIYWKLLDFVPPQILLLHRVIWSASLLAIILFIRGTLLSTSKKLFELKTLKVVLCSAALLAVNWLTYLWALAKDEFIAASLGYFICPLMSIALGAVFCGERLNRTQSLAVILMALGVALRTFQLGQLPLIALLLGSSFSLYMLIRKRAVLAALEGAFLEIFILAALTGLVSALTRGSQLVVLFEYDLAEWLLLLGTGIVTALPQLALTAGAKHVPLSFMGAAQYIAPTLTLLLALFYYQQKLTSADLLSFPLIWLGVIIFMIGPRLNWKAKAIPIEQAVRAGSL